MKKQTKILEKVLYRPFFVVFSAEKPLPALPTAGVSGSRGVPLHIFSKWCI